MWADSCVLSMNLRNALFGNTAQRIAARIVVIVPLPAA